MNVYDIDSIEEAKRIILTPIGDRTTEERWETETPYLLRLIEENLGLDEYSVVLDYGCGIGRMSKAIIEKFNCHVVGVDTSESMRKLAVEYVDSDYFYCCSPDMIGNINVSAAISIWVLQHCPDVEQDIARVRSILPPGRGWLVVNSFDRFIPMKDRWYDDEKDVFYLLCGTDVGQAKNLSNADVGDELATTCFWTVVR